MRAVIGACIQLHSAARLTCSMLACLGYMQMSPLQRSAPSTPSLLISRQHKHAVVFSSTDVFLLFVYNQFSALYY